MAKLKSSKSHKKFIKAESTSFLPTRDFQILFGVQIFLIFISLVHAWTLQYKSDLGPDGFISKVSYIAPDKPWMPPGTDTSSLLHLHFFGDWVLNVAYGGIPRPYDPTLEIPAQFAPIGLVFFSIAYLIGYKLSYILLLLLTLYIWITLINKLFTSFQFLFKILILFFFVFMTMPSLIAFDRGGTQLFCIGLTGLSYLYMTENKSKKAFTLFLLAVSMKPYLIFFVLVMLVRPNQSIGTRILNIARILFSLGIVNIILLMLFADNIVSGIRDQFNAIARFAGDWGIPWIMDGASMTSFISKTHEFFYGSNQTIKFMENFIPFWPRILAIAFILMLISVLLSPNVVTPIKLILILSTTSLVSPFSGPYTLAWISLAFCYLLAEIQNGFELKNLNFLNKISMYSLIISLYFGLVPYFGFLPKFSDVARHVPGNYLYVPFVITALMLSTIHSFRKYKPKTSAP